MIENDCYQSPKSLSDQVLENISKEELIQKWKQLDKYRLNLEERERKNLAELTKLKNIILMNYVSSKEIELGVGCFIQMTFRKVLKKSLNLNIFHNK